MAVVGSGSGSGSSSSSSSSSSRKKKKKNGGRREGGKEGRRGKGMIQTKQKPVARQQRNTFPDQKNQTCGQAGRFLFDRHCIYIYTIEHDTYRMG